MTSQSDPAASERALFQRLIQGFRTQNAILIRFAWVLAVFGIIVRIALIVIAGNQAIAPFSGVGDQIRYQTLADSIFHGNGFTYAGQPTALRPPLYPILLAGSHLAFGGYYLLAMRILQFLVGIALAYLCALIALKLFGIETAAVSFALALVMPTLLLTSLELQTEELTALVTVVFLYFLLREVMAEGNASVGLGLTSGLAMLLRFNCALLPIIGGAVCLWSRRRLKEVAVVWIWAGLLLSPWIVRNLAAFHGSVIYSSHGGINLLQGILSPEGRAQKGESERVRSAVGWLHTDLEVNSPDRLKFGSEDVLDKQARKMAILTWKGTNWKSGAKLLGKKLGWFWLSFDQFFETSSFSPIQQKLRACGVIIYWCVLLLASGGLLSLVALSKRAATAIAFYAASITVAHFPFVMNTRLRIPFIDPLLAVLAGAGVVLSVRKVSLALQLYNSKRGNQPLTSGRYPAAKA